MRGLERRDVQYAAAEEDVGRDDEHRHVDEPRERHRDHDVDPRVPVEAPRLALVARDDAVLEQRRVEVDHVRHHRRPEDPDGQQQRFAAAELRQHRVLRHRSERRMRVPELGDVARRDHADEADDHGLESPEPEALQTENREGRRARDERRGKEADPEEQMEADRGAEELREVRRHRDHLGLHPEPEGGSAREAFAADLRQVPSGRDAELRGQRLDEHRHQVRGDDHPHERVAELRAARDVRGEVAGVDVGDARDERRPEERQQTERSVAAQDLLAVTDDAGQFVGSRRHHES